MRDRKNVSVKLSYDEGPTWPVNKSLEAGFNSFGTDRLTVARFNLEWLTDGADTAAAK
jgi:sialidase-1